MRRRGLALFCAATVSAVAGLVVVAAANETDLAFTLGVGTTEVAADMRPGQQACQTPIDVRERFGAVQVRTATFFEPVPPLEMTIRDTGGGPTLARARIEPTGGQISLNTVRVPAVSAGREVSVCFRNVGRQVAGIYGGTAAAGSETLLDGRGVRPDMALVFLRERPASGLSLVPKMFRRATLFHPDWVGAWTFWLLSALLLLLVPALLGRALATAERD
jgi:hypothetical protein